MATENVSFVLSARDQTAAAFGAVRGSLNGLGNQLVSVRGLVGGLAAALGVGAFTAGVKAAAEAADAAAKMGDRFGIATEKLIGMQHAGALAGLSSEGLGTALKAQAKSLSDAARGSVEAAEAYAQLGIKAGEFIKLPMDQQFAAIVDKLGQVENVTLRNALAQEVLGKSAGDVMGLVAEGSESFAKAAADAQSWGLAISRVDAAQLEMANDAMSRAQAAARGLFTTIAIHVAPAVKALADFFADSSAEARGFKQQAGEASEIVITGIGYAANVVQGLRLAYAAVKLVVAEVATAALQAYDIFLNASIGIWSVLAKFPGPLGRNAAAVRDWAVNLQQQTRLLSESFASTAATIKAELDAIALEGLPKDKIIEKVREIRALMEKEAVEIAKRRQEMMRGSDVDIDQDKAPEGKKAAKDTWREQLAAKIERLREENMTELQLLDEKLMEKNLLLQSAFEAGLITEAFAAEQSALLRQTREAQELQHQAKLGSIAAQGILARRAFEQMNATQQAAHVVNTIAGISAASAMHNRTMFDINKAAGIGQAIVNTYVGVTKAIAQGGIFGFVTGALVLAQGMLQVAQIRKQQFGQGTSAPSIGGGMAIPVMPAAGAPAFPVSNPEPPQLQQATQPKRQINVTYVGSSDKKITYQEMVDDFIPLLSEAMDNGADVRLTLA